MRLVAWVVHARDHLLGAVALTRHLADDHVVLVVAGHGDQEIRRPPDPRPFEDEDLRCVTDDRRVLELVLKLNEALATLLDDRHLVAHAPKCSGEVRADLSASRDQDEHLGRGR